MIAIWMQITGGVLIVIEQIAVAVSSLVWDLPHADGVVLLEWAVDKLPSDVVITVVAVVLVLLAQLDLPYIPQLEVDKCLVLEIY